MMKINSDQEQFWTGDFGYKYGLKLVNYGFVYHRDNYFPLDDMNWFLMEK